MSKLNLLIALNAYSDLNPSNYPSQNVSKWTRDLQGIDITKPVSSSIQLAAGQTLSLFSGTVAIADNNTTTYDLSLKSGTSNTYIASHNSGTPPAFRPARTTGADATTAITVSQNGPLLVFTSTAGTSLSLITGGAVVGDEVRIGSAFNALNQGKFVILALTATSFSIQNPNGAAEGPVVLGASFASNLAIQGTTGTQIGDQVKIGSDFSILSQGTYEITDVAPTYIEFYSLASLPNESAIQSQLQIFNSSKQFIYIESDQKTSVTIDGNSNGDIEPFIISTVAKAGVFMKKGSMHTASITNISPNVANVYFMVAE
jgi:hypothetical protein